MAGDNSSDEDRTELVVVAGGTTAAAVDGVEQVIALIRATQPGAVVLHYDLRAVGHGVVLRRVRWDGADHTTVLELVRGGCVFCALRGDLLPLLRELGQLRAGRIVLQLDAALDAEQMCRTVLCKAVDGAPVTDAVELRGVITVVDAGHWLPDATSAGDLAGRGLAPLPGDERTLAQLVVAQVEFADLLVYAGTADSGLLARTDAVLARLTPRAPRLLLAQLDRRALLLEQLPSGARRGRPDDPHAALLRGQPPLHPDAGVVLTTFTARRPFHPERLHTAVGGFFDGVVHARGRIWLATRPDAVLWLQSTGGSVVIGHLGDWLATGDPDAWRRADPERRAMAALRWQDQWGDRTQDLEILTTGADPDDIAAALRAALLDTDELAAGRDAWRHYPDSFGGRHADPCQSTTPTTPRPGRHHDGHA